MCMTNLNDDISKANEGVNSTVVAAAKQVQHPQTLIQQRHNVKLKCVFPFQMTVVFMGGVKKHNQSRHRLNKS